MRNIWRNIQLEKKIKKRQCLGHLNNDLKFCRGGIMEV